MIYMPFVSSPVSMNKINRLRKQLAQRDHYQSHYKYVGFKSAIMTSPSTIP